MSTAAVAARRSSDPARWARWPGATAAVGDGAKEAWASAEEEV